MSFTANNLKYKLYLEKFLKNKLKDLYGNTLFEINDIDEAEKMVAIVLSHACKILALKEVKMCKKPSICN
jgi:hypothetical protein